MQVFSLPGYVIRNARTASRLLEAHCPDPGAARRRDAVRRWRGAMAQGLSGVAAAQAVGVPRSTLYRWQQRPEHRSRRPHKLRPPGWTPALVQAIERLRRDNPVWGKRKFGPLLRAQGYGVSDATVGRILAHLIHRQRVQPVWVFRQPQRARLRRPYARRLRTALQAQAPGEAVQIDTLSVTPIPGKTLKQFTAIDRLSRWTVALAASNATASSATRFLDKLLPTAPFPVQAPPDRRRLRVPG